MNADYLYQTSEPPEGEKLQILKYPHHREKNRDISSEGNIRENKIM